MIALVTGGTGGLGTTICRRLSSDGHHVAIGCHTRREAAEALAAELAGSNRAAMALAFDVTDPAAAAAAIQTIERQFGGLDAVINAAAHNVDGLLANLTPTDAARVHAVNVDGTLNVIRAALPPLVAGGNGRIVNFSSVLASRAIPGVTGYAATKGAIEALTRALAVELGPKRVTVNAVAPGLIDAGLGRKPVRAAVETMPCIVPLGRAGCPDDVAAVVSFLLSASSSYVTGAVIPVDGGLLAGTQTLGLPRPARVMESNS